MYKNLLFLIITTLILGSFSFPAFAQYETKDSVYYMGDDGIFSPEEKDAEAEYIKQKCERGTLQPKYYDCACIAGAFRVKRDEEKLKPQSRILQELYNDKESTCANPISIAGDSYHLCETYTKNYQPRDENNEKYCTCVANTVARDFSAEPRLRSKYIKHLKMNAMMSCRAKIIQAQP